MYHPYYTHRKYLIEQLNLLSKKDHVKILEFGVGDGSSSVFNEFALKNKNFQITAFETDPIWLNKVKNEYELPNYNFNYIRDWNDLLLDKNFKDKYDLIFVDQSPWEARIKTIDLLIDKSEVIILHDYDYYNKGLIDNIFDTGQNSFFGKYRIKNFFLNGFHEELPPTLVFNKIKNEK
jgi:hypothetical protein